MDENNPMRDIIRNAISLVSAEAWYAQGIVKIEFCHTDKNVVARYIENHNASLPIGISLCYFLEGPYPLYTAPKGPFGAVAASIALSAPAWLPIETAPKDGARVMFVLPEEMYPLVARTDDYWNGAIWLADASHWMPLPALPEDKP